MYGQFAFVAGRSFRIAAAVTLVTMAAGPAALADSSWPGWGGEGQDFVVRDVTGLAAEWPEAGPKQIWSRDLGEGYSAIVTDGDRLYTMCRRDGNEFVVALDPKTGETAWETGYELKVKDGHVSQFGEGPRGTPLVDGDRIYAIGVRGTMTCVDKNSGSIVWKQELWDELDGTFLNHGYSSSPFAYKDTVIALVGGEGHGIVAFNKADGSIKWQKQDFGNSYSTPKLINIDGKDQLICFMGGEIIGLDPASGELKWSVAHENQWRQNCTLPIWTEDNVLVFTSLGEGTKAVRLSLDGDETKVEELWSTRKMRLHHSNAVQVGDYVYGFSGDNVKFFMAVNVKTGELAWRERGFTTSNLIHADGKFIALDEDGNLMLITATPESAKIVSKVPLLEKVAWTAPTLVGKTLYVRDQNKIVALDLG